jgi:hypothetical protein
MYLDRFCPHVTIGMYNRLEMFAVRIRLPRILIAAIAATSSVRTLSPVVSQSITTTSSAAPPLNVKRYDWSLKGAWGAGA